MQLLHIAKSRHIDAPGQHEAECGAVDGWISVRSINEDAQGGNNIQGEEAAPDYEAEGRAASNRDSNADRPSGHTARATPRRGKPAAVCCNCVSKVLEKQRSMHAWVKSAAAQLGWQVTEEEEGEWIASDTRKAHIEDAAIDSECREYAVVTRLGDGRLEALSQEFASRELAETELSWMCADDFYRDRHPLVGTRAPRPWVPVDESKDQ